VEPKDPESGEFEVVEGELVEGPDYSTESDILFRTQMRLADAFYAHWKKGLAILVTFLASVLFYGLWQGKIENAQKQASETMAKIDRKMPAVSMLQLQGQWALDDASDSKRTRTLEAIAQKYEEVGADSVGTAAAEAWLKAGDTWMRVDNADSAEKAYNSVLTIRSEGLFAVGALNGLAAILIGKDDNKGAIAQYRTIADLADDGFAEAALLAIAQVSRAMGDNAAATGALDEITKRFPESLRGAEVEWERDRIGTDGDQG
jgi:tetratricopeptide (TPR) repeat protein